MGDQEIESRTGEDHSLPDLGFRFDDTYTKLPSVFFTPGKPHPAPEPRLVVVNETLADSLGVRLEGLSPDEQAMLLSGTRLVEGSNPFSQAYAGHQFGGFSVLGDGRAHVLGEHPIRFGEPLATRLGDGMADDEKIHPREMASDTMRSKL